MKRIPYLILLTALFLNISASVSAGPCEEYETKIRWQSSVNLLDFGWMHSHDSAWPWVYSIGSDNELVVTNVTDPDHPTITTIFELPFTGSLMKVDQNHLYISGYSHYLWSIDISNPEQPALGDSIFIGPSATAMHIADGKAWIGSYSKVLTVIDISDPDNLTRFAKVSLDYPVETIQVCDGLAYIGSDNYWGVYDFSNPTTPREVMQLPDAAMSFALQGQTLIAGRQQEISTYDVSNPANPTLLSTRAMEYDVRKLVIHNGMVLAQQSNLYYVDVFRLQNDGILEQFFRFRSPSYYDCTFMLADDHIYYGTEQNLHILEFGDMQSVTGGDAVPTPGWGIDTKISGDHAFSASDANGLIVFDTSDPLNPVFAGSGFSTHFVHALVLQDNLAYTVGENAITVFDISDPTLPFAISHTDGLASSHPSDILLFQDTIWLAQEYGYLSAVNISAPLHPQPSVVTDFEATGLAQSDGYLHTIDADGTYRVLSLESIPPVEVANLSLSIGGSSIDIQGDRAIIGHSWYGLSLLDISDPTDPVLLNHESILGGADKVTFRGDTAIVSNYYCAHVLDVSDPSEFRKIGTIWDGGFDHTVFPSGEILIFHCLNYDLSMQVYPAPCGVSETEFKIADAAARSLTIHPNPFNPQTAVSFDLPAAASVNIRIFDLTGRLVKTLASGEVRSAGVQSWNWLGRDNQGRKVSSGVYLVRLEAGQFRTTGRMVLVR